MRKGYEYNNPLIARVVESHKGKLAKTFSFVSVEPANVILNTIKKAEPKLSFSMVENAENENIWILRLFETFGKETETKITLPLKIKRAVVSNLLEEDGGALEIDEKTAKIKISGYRVVTVKIWF